MSDAPGEQELLDALNRIKVSDVLVETMQGLASFGYHRLDSETRDLEQTRLAIEALKAIGGVLEGVVPAELTRDFNQVVANLQLAYASAVAEKPPRWSPFGALQTPGNALFKPETTGGNNRRFLGTTGSASASRLFRRVAGAFRQGLVRRARSRRPILVLA